MKKLNLNAIRIDGGTQSRVEINNEAVGDYAEAIKVGIEFPAVVVFHDGVDYWLADGFHRYHSHKQAGKVSILADVRDGTVRDAILHSFGANDTHGLRRSNADKRKIAEAMLRDEEWSHWSDGRISKETGLSDRFIGSVRKAISEPFGDTPPVRTVERAGKTYQQDTSRIGKSTPAKTAPWDKPAPASDDADHLAEAHHTITELADENEQLRDKLAVESLMDSEDAKTQTGETIRELRALVKTLQAENAALKVSRDTYQRESSEAKKSAIYWRKQAEKAAKDAAA